MPSLKALGQKMQKLLPKLSFCAKVGEGSRSWDQIYWYGWKGIAKRKTHAKFKGPRSKNAKLIANVIFFTKVGQG